MACGLLNKLLYEEKDQLGARQEPEPAALAPDPLPARGPAPFAPDLLPVRGPAPLAPDPLPTCCPAPFAPGVSPHTVLQSLLLILSPQSCTPPLGRNLSEFCLPRGYLFLKDK